MLFAKDLDIPLQDVSEGLILEGRATGYSVGSRNRIVLVLLHALLSNKSLGFPFSVVLKQDVSISLTCSAYVRITQRFRSLVLFGGKCDFSFSRKVI